MTNLSTDSLRQPRAIIKINGIIVNWISIEVTTTTFYMADNYKIMLPMNNQPNNFTFDFVSTAVPLSVEIYIGFPDNPASFSTSDLDLMIIGDVDRLDIDPLTQVYTFSGRDLTSRLIDNKTYAKYPNATPSEIATLLAKSHNLTPVVTNVGTEAGYFYAIENTLLTRETTEWDLICFLAQQVDFVVYVEKDKLIFKPRPNQAQNPFILQYQSSNINNASPTFNGTQLSISRSLTLANDVIVKIRVPYNPQTGKAFTQSISSKKARSSSQNAQIYSYTFPGLTKEQALSKGKQILRDITIHELRLNATVPGENSLKKDSLIQLRGTGTKLDQNYFADTVMRRISMEDGYVMEINAKNHAVDSQIIL